RVRIKAVEHLYRQAEGNDTDALLMLTDMLDDPERKIRAFVAQALSEKGRDIRLISTRLVDIIRDPQKDPNARLQALRLLKRAGNDVGEGDPAYAGLLQRIAAGNRASLGDDQEMWEDLRSAAADALVTVPQRQIDYELLLHAYREIGDPHHAISISLAGAILTETTGEHTRQLDAKTYATLVVSGLQHGDPIVRNWILARILFHQDLRDPAFAELIPSLTVIVGDREEDGHLRGSAAECIAVIARHHRGVAAEEAVRVLKEHVRDPSLHVRFGVMKALRVLQPDALKELGIDDRTFSRTGIPDADAARERRKMLWALRKRSVERTRKMTKDLGTGAPLPEVKEAQQDVPVRVRDPERPANVYETFRPSAQDAYVLFNQTERTGENTEEIVAAFHQRKIEALQGSRIVALCTKLFPGASQEELSGKRRVIQNALVEALGADWDNAFYPSLSEESAAKICMELAKNLPGDAAEDEAAAIIRTLQRHDESYWHLHFHRQAINFLKIGNRDAYREFLVIVGRRGNEEGRDEEIFDLYMLALEIKKIELYEEMARLSKQRNKPLSEVMEEEAANPASPLHVSSAIAKEAKTPEQKNAAQATLAVAPVTASAAPSEKLEQYPLQTIREVGAAEFAKSISPSADTVKTAAVEALRKTGAESLITAFAGAERVGIHAHEQTVLFDAVVAGVPYVLGVDESGRSFAFVRGPEGKRVFLSSNDAKGFDIARLRTIEMSHDVPPGFIAYHPKLLSTLFSYNAAKHPVLPIETASLVDQFLGVIDRLKIDPWEVLEQLDIIDANQHMNERRTKQFAAWLIHNREKLPSMKPTIDDFHILTNLWDRHPDNEAMLLLSFEEAKRKLVEA
ncbi:MAG: hypothetical protein PHH13_04995, partial [Candidatus Peribacteraceae bacterium]|nr:hypothetical protein [Candidatus Peribacteraceae bacterium]